MGKKDVNRYKRNRVTFLCNDWELERMDRAAELMGTSRSQLLRYSLWGMCSQVEQIHEQTTGETLSTTPSNWAEVIGL